MQKQICTDTLFSYKDSASSFSSIVSSKAEPLSGNKLTWTWVKIEKSWTLKTEKSFQEPDFVKYKLDRTLIEKPIKKGESDDVDGYLQV